MKHYWAYIALIVLTLSFGLLLANTREVCLILPAEVIAAILDRAGYNR